MSLSTSYVSTLPPMTPIRSPGFLALAHVMDNVLELENDAQIRIRFDMNGVERISDILDLTSEDLKDMGLSIVNRKRVLRLIAWYYEQPSPTVEVWFTLTADDFDSFVMSSNTVNGHSFSSGDSPVPDPVTSNQPDVSMSSTGGSLPRLLPGKCFRKIALLQDRPFAC